METDRLCYCLEWFAPKTANQKYCSLACREKYTEYKRRWLPAEQQCLQCGKTFLPRVANCKYCSKACSKTPKTWAPETLSCSVCGCEFAQKVHNQKYCSTACCDKANAYKRKGLQALVCQHCKQPFDTYNPSQKFCSKKCNDLYLPPPKTVKVKDTAFPLTFRNEDDFAQWFRRHYFLYGIKRLVKMDDLFPDVIAESNKGQLLRIELEFHADNFRQHGHCPEHCDVIVSFLTKPGTYTLSGLPIIALCEATGHHGASTDYNPASLKPTPFVRRLINRNDGLSLDDAVSGLNSLPALTESILGPRLAASS